MLKHRQEQMSNDIDNAGNGSISFLPSVRILLSHSTLINIGNLFGLTRLFLLFHQVMPYKRLRRLLFWQIYMEKNLNLPMTLTLDENPMHSEKSILKLDILLLFGKWPKKRQSRDFMVASIRHKTTKLGLLKAKK